MEIILRLAGTLVLSAPALCAAWSIWLAYSNPVVILQMQQIVARDNSLSKRIRVIDGLYLILAVIGYGQFVFGGFRLAFDLLSGYGQVQDDEWVPFVDSITVIVAGYGAFAFFGVLNDYARLKFVKLNRDRNSLPAL
jgi:hypothetical protein